MKLTYKAPDDKTRIIDPTADQIAMIILLQPFEYWQQGGNGQASLRFSGGPALSLMLPEPGAFFLEFLADDRLVPYNGAACTSFITTDVGGDPFRIPHACLVTPEVAAAVVREFVRTSDLPQTLAWRPMGDVPFEHGWYDG